MIDWVCGIRRFGVFISSRRMWTAIMSPSGSPYFLSFPSFASLNSSFSHFPHFFFDIYVPEFLGKTALHLDDGRGYLRQKRFGATPSHTRQEPRDFMDCHSWRQQAAPSEDGGGRLPVSSDSRLGGSGIFCRISGFLLLCENIIFSPFFFLLAVEHYISYCLRRLLVSVL